MKLRNAAVAVAVLLLLGAGILFGIPAYRKANPRGGWSQQVEASLKNAANAQEEHCASSPRCYTDSVADLKSAGLQTHSQVSIRITEATVDRFCIEGTHDDLRGRVWSFDSEIAETREEPCS